MKAQYNKLSLAVAASLALTACGGGGGGGGGGGTPVVTNSAPVISGVPATSVDEGNAYRFVPVASDANGDTLTFSVKNLPSWASLDAATGVISGQPSFADVGVANAITLSVSDGQTSVSLPAFSITVVDKNTSPNISGLPATTAEEGGAYSFTPSASDSDGDTLIFSAQNLPSWASLDTATGVISGQPNFADVGVSNTITLSVSDGQASVSLPAFTITVAAKIGLTGKVVDGYIRGATVFLDINRNAQLDAGEPSAISDDSGAYRLPLSDADIKVLASSPVVAFAGEGATDITTGEMFDDSPLVLTAPPILNFTAAQADNLSQAITPFTSQVFEQTKETLEQVVSGELESGALELELAQAKVDLVQTLADKHDIKTEQIKDALFDDFLAAQLTTGVHDVVASQAIAATDDLQESKKILDQEAAKLKDNQKVNISIHQYSFVEWHSMETLLLKEVTKEIITTQDNGDKLFEKKITKYRVDKDGKQIMVAGEPLIYEILTVTTNKNADGTLEEFYRYESDKNGDNERQFKGQTYRQGNWSATGKTYFEYFDESAPQVELPDWQGGANEEDHTYEGESLDIKAAVLAGNYAEIDFIHYTAESKKSEGENIVSSFAFKQYESANGVYNLNQPSYAETRIDTQSATGVIHEIKKDWGGDGSINEDIRKEIRIDGTRIVTKAHPEWPDFEDDDWQEYSEYSWANSSLGSFWLEVTETQKMLDGKKVFISDGKRMLLDTVTNTAKVDTSGNPYIFNSWTSMTTERTPELTVEYAQWMNKKLDDSLFNSPEQNLTVSDDIGQKVVYSVKYANDLWLNWEYPEFGARNISDLPAVVDAQLAANGNDYRAVDLTSLLEGESTTVEQDKILPTPSFAYDADGKKRTWYIVTNVFDNELKVHETSLPNLHADWKMLFLAGGTKIYVPEAFVASNGYTTNMVNLPLISEFDADKGSFSFAPGFAWDANYPFHMFLDKEAAQAKLAELNK